MGLIGIAEAARRAGMTTDGIRLGLRNAAIEIIELSPRAYAVDEDALAAWIASRPVGYRRGRPPGAKNKPKVGEDG